jgi:hypothetical protein
MKKGANIKNDIEEAKKVLLLQEAGINVQGKWLLMLTIT